MASSQNSKEATRRPVTWEHGRIYIFPKQMGKGGGKEADSCQNFDSFQNVFLLLLSLSLFLSRRWYFYPLPFFQVSSYPPIHPFPISGNWNHKYGGLGGRRLGGLLAGLLLGPFHVCSSVFQCSLQGCYLGLEMRYEARRGWVCFAEGRCRILPFSQNYSALVLKP